MISYAQNYEDVLLNRIFKDINAGFYVDLGAGHPTFESVTKHFYDQGWRGINIEPRKNAFQMLQGERAADLNLNCCISNKAGTALFYEVGVFEDHHDTGGSSSLNQELAQEMEKAGVEVSVYEIEIMTLQELLSQYADRGIDFMKIDVEGHEMEVIQGNDWSKFRPKVLVIEALSPGRHEKYFEKWEQLLLDANYLFALFDGLNRYYVASEQSHLLEKFGSPVNVLDSYVPWQTWKTIGKQQALITAQALELQRFFASRSWRITAPLRAVMRVARSVKGFAVSYFTKRKIQV